MVEHSCCKFSFWLYLLIVAALVIFAGLMSGLTLGLMSLGLVDLEVLLKSGSEKDRKYAAKILPVVKNQHLLLCTLLLGNAMAMEALPIFLDSLVNAWGAILISVTMILLFGEIFPQAICSRYGLAVGATMTPVVRVLVIIFFPVTYPISKLLDYLLGKSHLALFRRVELMTLVHMHGNEAGKGGELTHDETTIITGALELTQKTAKDAMTPISSTFCIDINTNLDMKTMQSIMSRNHSRIPVYMGSPTNIIGLILVKNLLVVRPEDNLPLKQYSTIRRMPRVEENMPLYDILNEFQKGHSHMAAVVRCSKQKLKDTKRSKQHGTELGEKSSGKTKVAQGTTTTAVALDVAEDASSEAAGNVIFLERNSAPIFKEEDTATRHHGSHKGKRRERMGQDDVLDIIEGTLSLPEDEEVVGIITMEDVIEELLQEEILDEKDEYVDIHERIKISMSERSPTLQPTRSMPATRVLLPKAVVSPLAASQRTPVLHSAISTGCGIAQLKAQVQTSKSEYPVGLSDKPQPKIRLHSVESHVQGGSFPKNDF
ncbi:hypothetical protein GOP47_0004786 [Adiantum capillus-veneris]|uniref:CNNM transmembrane domain-containing protein n=1 Tax=Adiantum capillus-veneris TaxID=13818 RepID=A0A9D4V4N0_ADICA|nr:hypothetical protein GOP47_0004786 [Adiantum capillus-veneris]